MGKKSNLFASAAFPLLSLTLAFQPATAMAAARSVGTEPAAVRQIEQGSFEVAQDAPSEEELLKKKRKQKEEAPAEQAPAAEQPKEAPAEKPKAERKEAPEPKAEPEPPKAEAAPKEEPAPQAESKPERKAKKEAQPEAKPEAEPQQEQQPVTQEKPRKPKKQAEPEAQPEPEQQPAAKEAQPETEQAQPEAKPEGGKKGRDKAKAKTETAAPEAVTPAEQQATPETKPEAKPEVKPTAETPAAKKPKKGEAAAPAEKATEDKAAAPEAAPAEKPAHGTAAKPAAEQPSAEQPAGEKPAAPATDTAQPAPDATGGQQVEQAIPAPEKVSPEELERRKKIAEDPAKSSETVVLPVENGAAVLDSDKDADRSKGREGRRDRDKLRAESQEVKLPTSDADAQAAAAAAPTVKLEAVTSERGTRLDTRPQFARPEGARIDDRTDDNRVIIQYNNQVIVRSDDDRRFLRDGERPIYEELSRDRYRETITRPEGYRIVTIRNRYGDIIQRSRVDARGREYVLYYSPDLYEDPDRDYFEDPGADLPPMRLRVPLNDYIIDTSSEPDRDYYEFLSEPPVEQVERVYSLDEVKYSARIRDKVRRIDLDTITFATGSADIPMTQARTLRKVADAINQVLEKDPSETFLIEGHTDAVGSDQSNLILSDQRAESVANVLSDVYGIAPENLATQGYGERYLKVTTSGPEQENRRVTIRRVTPLVRPVAAKQ
ncbi:hypothetical protein ATY77_16155 [Rhizobium sp. R634]|uniref:OmpA family protein n=1 Tax=Rhizobium sp. R634 TaxID=1764274 RepID=UPI000B533FBB|nr:OmpA family protein [Rhizobium sp. R634]OWV71091.1 hypothetical protein ATY77_16155 [Rhizobium sp. R634]